MRPSVAYSRRCFDAAMDATPGSLLHAELAENSASNAQLPAQILPMRRRAQFSYKGDEDHLLCLCVALDVEPTASQPASVLGTKHCL